MLSTVRPRNPPRVNAALVGFVSASLAALTLLLPHAPGYDPWAWLIWGREVAQGGLDTVDGPAFKPLPVLIDAVLWRATGDDVAPTLWLLVARTGAVAAVLLAARTAFRLAGGSWSGAAVAAAGVALTAGFAWHGAIGSVEGGALALGLLAVACALDGAHRRALAAGAALALLRPESWPFLLAYGGWRASRDAALRPWIALGVPAVLALWFVPEWLGSGNPLRSGDRARVPNPGQPVTAAFPAWAALRAGLALPLLPLLVAALMAPGRARVPLLLGVAWIVEVALMAQLVGTSGEPRYSLPGAALIAVSGAVGVVTIGRRARELAGRHAVAARALMAALATTLVAAMGLRAGGSAAELRHAADQTELTATLPAAIAAAGGRQRLVACGRPATGRYRGPVVAWALRVPKRTVATPSARGDVVLRSRIRRTASIQPAPLAGGRALGRSTRWLIEGRC